MAFEGLSEKLQATFKKIRGKGKVSEKDIKDAMREVRMALLEADVNFKVAKELINKISEKALGAEVLESLTPAQQIIKIVRDELTELMGGGEAKLPVASKPPTVILMAGLNGAGKTTTSGKLAGLLKKQGKRPLLVACDVYRPAAVKQLEIVGEGVGVPVYKIEGETNPVSIAGKSIAECDTSLYDTLIQDSVNIAKGFNEAVGIDGVVLSKLDGDTRGGAAISVKAVCGKPIMFSCIGEKLTDIEPFYPDRMASRILGMGDVLTLIDKAQEAFDEKQAIELEKKIRQQRFDLNDFLGQMEQMKNLGSLSSIAGMIPGLNQKALANANIDDKQMDRVAAIIKSMTPGERENPSIINSSRKQRIAAGCGMQVQDVNRLLRQFEDMQKMMKQFTGKGGRKKLARFGLK